MAKDECCNINALVKEFYDYLYAYMVKRVGDTLVAQDLLQEVMLRLVESHKKNQEVRQLKAWLFQLARHTLYDYYQKKGGEIPAGLEADLFQDTNETQELMATDFVVPAIELLPEKYATPLRMSDIEGLPQKDIASRLDLSLSATKMRIQRARKMLRELYVECCDISYDKNGAFVSCTIKPHCEPFREIEKELKNKSK